MISRDMLKRCFRWCLVPVGVGIVLIAALQPETLARTFVDGNASPEGATILTRGPIHEAFGQPTVFNPKPGGLLITKKPPATVEELPPDEKPQGDNVAWIGGYWSWDEDRDNHLWVSGFWRVLPPGRQWMPGYWNETEGQYQWVSGYWSPLEAKEQEIIPEAPKETLEQGPPPTATGDDQIWIPGTWVYRSSHYLWRPGYFVANQPGWVWVPATYYWTPSGYIFVDGFWDWSPRRRGILFAPCYFDPVVVYRPGYYYRPTIVLDIDVITPHFFCRPHYGHYYFGDYYASSYLSIGITPWFNFTYARGGFYSSDYAYYDCHYRRLDPQWSINLRLGYDRCRNNVAYRPARTYVQQTTIINNITVNNVKNTTINNSNVHTMALAKPLKEVTAASAKSNDSPIKYEKITETKARDFGKTASDVRKVSLERGQLESRKTTTNTSAATQTKIVKLPQSPIVAKVPVNTGAAANLNTAAGGKQNIAGAGQNLNTPPPIPGASRIANTGTGIRSSDIGKTSQTNVSNTTLPKTDNANTTGNKQIDGGTTPGKMDRIPPLDKGNVQPGKTLPPATKNTIPSGSGKSGSSSGNSKGSSSGKEKERGKDKP